LQKTKNLKVIFFTTLVLTLIFIQFIVAKGQTQNTQKFFEFRWPGMEVRVNATSETLPKETMTIILLVKSKADDVYIEFLDLTVFGFIEGQNKTLLGNMFQDAFPLNYNETRKFNRTFPIPADVWGATCGELSFQYSIGGFSYPLSSLGFTMTHVRNIKLQKLEEAFQSLSENFTKLQQNYTWLEGNYTQLEGNYTELKGKYDELSQSVGELGNTRHITIILAITTVIFVATTFYLIIRRPRRQSW
jgi:hypothetical protein